MLGNGEATMKAEILRATMLMPRYYMAPVYRKAHKDIRIGAAELRVWIANKACAARIA